MSPILGTVSSQALWFATRGTGVVSLLFLTASVVLGVTTSARFETRRWPRFVIEGLHRSVSLLVVVFVALHVVTTVVDGFAPIGFLDAVVPFHSPYRPLWLGLGSVACDLLLALCITSLVRVRLGYRVWRAVHWLAYACWPIALSHGIGIGSDAGRKWMIGLDIGCIVAVVAAVAWRWIRTTRLDRSQPWVTVAPVEPQPLRSRVGSSW